MLEGCIYAPDVGPVSGGCIRWIGVLFKVWVDGLGVDDGNAKDAEANVVAIS